MKICGLSSHFIQASPQMSSPQRWLPWPSKRALTSILHLFILFHFPSINYHYLKWYYIFTCFLYVWVLISYCCYNKLSQTWWYKHKFLILQFWRPEIWIGSYWAKSRYQYGCVLSGASKRKFISLRFLSCRGHLHIPSSIFAVNNSRSSSSHFHTHSYASLFYLLRTLMITLGRPG